MSGLHFILLGEAILAASLLPEGVVERDNRLRAGAAADAGVVDEDFDWPESLLGLGNDGGRHR